jgi:hypothetical protein
MMDFITRAFAESKLAIWARYLNAEELAFTRAALFRSADGVAGAGGEAASGLSGEATRLLRGQALARRGWRCSSLTPEPGRTQQKFRLQWSRSRI